MTIGNIIIIILFVLLTVIYPAIKNGRQMRPGEIGPEVNLDYGTPEKRLYTTTKVLTQNHIINITDADYEEAYRSWSEFPSLADRTEVTRADGALVARLEKGPLSIAGSYSVQMEDGAGFLVSGGMINASVGETTVNELGWRLYGKFMDLQFVIYDEDGAVIAAVGKIYVPDGSKYSVDIFAPEHEEKIIAILVAVQHMVRERQVNPARAQADAQRAARRNLN